MGRAPCINKEWKRGAWTPDEDKILADYIKAQGEGKWKNVPKQTGLKRCGKACRLRWMNYLRPNIEKGNITPAEEDLIIRLHELLGNRWSLIAGRLPGRTDDEIKNYWDTYLAKRERVKQYSNECQIGKWAIAEAGQSHEYDQAAKTVILQPTASSCADKVLDTVKPTKPRIDDGDSDAATVESDFRDGQYLSPMKHAEEDVPGCLMDFDLGDVTFSEFLDSDFAELTDSEMFRMNNWTQEEGSNSEIPHLSTETTAVQELGNTTNQSSETPIYSSETLWSASDCFETSSHSVLGSWDALLDSAEDCIIWE